MNINTWIGGFENKFHQNIFTDCPKKNDLDIMFVLDGSRSVGKENFTIVKNWTKAIISQFYKSNNKSQVGVVQYSHYFKK